MSRHHCWAVLCRYRCHLLLAEIPKGVDRNSELKQRRHLWDTGQISDLISKVLGQQNSGPHRRTAIRMQSQTDQQRGTARETSGRLTTDETAREASLCLDSPRIPQQSRGWAGGGAAQGSAVCRTNWTTALNPRSSGIGTHPTSAEFAEAARTAWGGGRYEQVSLRCRTSNCRP